MVSKKVAKGTGKMLTIRDDRHMRSLTGLSNDQFTKLLETFSRVYQETQQAAYEAGVAAGIRQRKPGGGAKGKLPGYRDKLQFVLYYYKVYPTFDVLGTQFDMARSKAHTNLYKLTPILEQTLVQLGVLPHREFHSPAELQAALDGVDQILIDVTERAYRRSQDNATQKDHYSGKKKRHTVKNTVISTVEKIVLFVGRTFSGHNHDYTMLKTELPPDQDWFEELKVLVDLGYLGIQKDYVGEQIEVPTRKPRKSKKNPHPQLTAEQKAANRAISQIRIFVENAIGGIKRYNILVHRFRNHTEDFDDTVIGICAGLWNFSLGY
jgi:hypothetical protein